MIELTQLPEEPKTIDRLVELIRESNNYKVLPQHLQRIVEDGIKDSWERLHNPHDVLPELILEEKRKTFLKRGAVRILDDMLKGHIDMSSYLKQLRAERAAEGNGNGPGLK